MAAEKRSWFLTLGFDPFSDSPSRAEAESAFGSYKSTVGKESTRSSGKSDEFKQIAKDMDANKEAIISEVILPSSRDEAKAVVLEAASVPIDVLKLQSSDFDEAMMAHVRDGAKKALRKSMYPKGKYKISDEAVEEAILAAGCAPVGKIAEEARIAFEGLQIDEVSKSKFRNIDKSLEDLEIASLYAFADPGTGGDPRMAPSDRLIARATEIEASIPRDADSAGAAKATLAKSAIETFGDEDLRSAYDKHLAMTAVDRRLSMMKTLGAGGKPIAADLAKTQVGKLADDLQSADEAAKLFFGYLAANDLAADISYGDLLNAVRGESSSPNGAASAAATAEVVPSPASTGEHAPASSESGATGGGYQPYNPYAPIDIDLDAPVSATPVTATSSAPTATIPVPKAGQSVSEAAAAAAGNGEAAPAGDDGQHATDDADTEDSKSGKKKMGCGCRIVLGLIILQVVVWIIGAIAAGFMSCTSSTPAPSSAVTSSSSESSSASSSEITKSSTFVTPAFPAKETGSDAYGYINTGTQWDLEPQFESATFFSDGLAPQEDSLTGKYGYIDETGAWAISPRFDAAATFSDGMAWVEEDGVGEGYNDDYYYINTSGNMVFDRTFKEVTSFSEGYAIVCWDDSDTSSWSSSWRYGVMDANGGIVAPLTKNGEEISASAIDAFSDGLARIHVQGGKYGFVDISGKLVVPDNFDEVGNFSEGLAAAYTSSSNAWGYIDKTGNTVIRPQFQIAGEFNDGMAPVRPSNGDYGYIDAMGSYVFEPTLKFADEFCDGYAAVRVDDDYGLINTSGDFVIEPMMWEIVSSPIYKGTSSWTNASFDPNTSSTNWEELN